MGKRNKGKKKRRSQKINMAERVNGKCIYTNPETTAFKKISAKIQKGIDDNWNVNCSEIAKKLNICHTGVLETFSYMIKNLQK